MKFSKEKFLKHADNLTRNRLREHLNILNGMEVEHGSQIHYTVDGKPWLLYPVMDTWCDQ